MAFSITQLSSMLDKPILQELTSTGLAAAAHDLGYTVRSADGREYMYVKFDNGSAVAAVAGGPVNWVNSEDFAVVGSDVSEGSVGVAVGCFLSVLGDGLHGWIQTKGRAVDCPCTDGSNGEVSAGDALGITSLDGLWVTVTVGGTQAEKAIARMAGDGGFATIELIE